MQATTKHSNHWCSPWLCKIKWLTGLDVGRGQARHRNTEGGSFNKERRRLIQQMYPVLWNVRINRSGESAVVTELTYFLMGEGRNAIKCNKQKQNAINKNIRVESICRSQCYHQTKTKKKMTSLGRGCGETETLVACWWECKMEQPATVENCDTSSKT